MSLAADKKYVTGKKLEYGIFIGEKKLNLDGLDVLNGW